MILIVLLRLLEISLELLKPSIIKNLMLSTSEVSIGIFTFLQAPLVMSFVSEITHPIATIIPNLLMFLITGALGLIICQKNTIVQLVPLLLSLILTRFVE
jgi:hypothetical protein